MNLGAWFDRLSGPPAPRWTLKRQRARLAADMLARHYEAASHGRRTAGWRRSSGDANAVGGSALARLRENAHEAVRNNAYAESMVSTVVDHAVGWGIVGKPARDTSARVRAQAEKFWKPWAETTACDADGRHDFAGLQKLAMRTIAVSGEVLIRRRWRRPEDKLPLPMQIQVMEPDFLDTAKDGIATPPGGRIIQGVEFDSIGRLSKYWLFHEHPGSGMTGSGSGASRPIPASEIAHVFKSNRPGQVRGVSWFAPILLLMNDFDGLQDATLMKQKVAACLAVITSDVDGTAPPLGLVNAANPTWDGLQPGGIHNVAPGRSVTVVDPPSVTDYDPYSKTVLRAIAAGFGVTYEDVTGDYAQMPFSAARMSRLRHWARVDDWRWRMLIPQLCDPVWAWAMQAAGIMGLAEAPGAEWTAPPPPMIDPAAEGLAYQRNIRTGIMTWSEAVRERGYDPDVVRAEMVEDNRLADKLGIVLDSDVRNTTQSGQLQGEWAASFRASPAAPAPAAPEPAPPSTSGNGASSNGHGDTDLARAFRLLERALSRQTPIHIENHPASPGPAPSVTVSSPSMTIEKGAIHTEMHAAPIPDVRIDEGAVQVSVPVTVTPAPPAPAPEPTRRRRVRARSAATPPAETS